MLRCSYSCSLSSPNMSASLLLSAFHPSLPAAPFPFWFRANNRHQVTGSDRWRFGWKASTPTAVTALSRKRESTKRKKGFSWMGMEGGEEWAEVEMWTEVVECRLWGAEPLIDCSGLTLALCDCHFKHTPTVYFYSCEGLLLLSLTLTLILAETLYKFLILEVQTNNSDSGISYEFGSFKPTNFLLQWKI